MKHYALLLTALVLTASLFTGCGCTNRNMDTTSAPTVLPTNEEIWTNETTTAPTTRATTEATMPTVTQSTEFGSGDGNGALEDTTGGSTETTENAAASRARRMIPGGK